ncbi:DUF2927 domain-containing protein [Vibrio furnissii]|uniref:DUF2927 domain-containing protein n=1 Tax=Vibrio furnissii TaxID=29494 RepID=UPI00399A5906
MRIWPVVTALLFSPLAWSANTWEDPAFIEQAFVQVALRNEYAAGAKPLVKWHHPIKVWFEHKVADRDLHEALALAQLKHLARVTGHSITQVANRRDANLIWVFTQQSNWKNDVQREMGAAAAKHIYGAVCLGNYRTRSDTHEIVSAAVVIPADQARSHGKLLACVVEEVTQVMGLPNDSEQAYPSIFNDKTPDSLLSPLDVILLKLLYEPALKPGMNEQQVRPILRTLIQRYKKDGVLAQAVQISHSSDLYDWLP